ncbi:MAG TPA: ECF transporter S component [Firmicutes bacterium]|nr:ECF transporter S component [Bacillota bacterium]
MQVRYLTRSAVLLALAVAVQMMGLPQLVTGSAVNTVLYLTTWAAPPLYGVLVGSLTPVIAFWRGIMPAGPLVPFIAVGNGILVLVFWASQRLVQLAGQRHAGHPPRTPRGSYGWVMGGLAGVLAAASLKAGFLAFSVARLVHVPPQLVAAMQWPQLVTALTGGVIALALYSVLRPVFSRQGTMG